MVIALRELFAKSKHPSHGDKEACVQTLVSILEQAQAIGHAHVAQEEPQERAIAWGGKFQDLLSSAWNIVNHFVNRIAQWFTGQQASDEPITEEAIVEKVDSLAGQVASVEVHAAIEEDIVRELTLAGVKKVKSVCEPDACQDCQDKAAADPVSIDEYEPPPYHGRCRCGTIPADEE